VLGTPSLTASDLTLNPSSDARALIARANALYSPRCSGCLALGGLAAFLDRLLTYKGSSYAVVYPKCERSFGNKQKGRWRMAVSYVLGTSNRCTGLLICGAALSFLGLASSVAGQCQPTFAPTTSYPAGGGTVVVATGDFNRDGRPDVAVTNGTGVSILMGNGDGTFQSPTSYMFGTSSRTVLVRDFNNDGKLDLAVADHNSNSVFVLLGNGDGTFQSAVSNTVASLPQVMGSGDFNSDGKPDLVTANEGSGNVSILLSNGNGTFQSAVNYACANQPYGIAIGDFNGDGRLDLAVPNVASSSLSILIGNGNGTFQNAVNTAVGNQANAITSGDFNRDGKLDLALINSAGGLSVLLGNGNGTFQSPTLVPGVGPGGIIVADIDGDGKQDLVVTIASVLLLGNGDGTFKTPLSLSLGGGGSVVAGDFNRDGKTDLACDGGSVHVLLQSVASDPAISQQPSTQSVLSGASAAFSVTANGSGPLTFQWRRNGSPLVDGGNISGATTMTLTVNPTAIFDNASAFDCIVSNSCRSARSDPASLSVAPRCRADFNNNGSVSVQDVFDFLAAYFANCP